MNSPMPLQLIKPVEGLAASRKLANMNAFFAVSLPVLG
jgi:hypothetical protein